MGAKQQRRRCGWEEHSQPQPPTQK